MISALLMEEMPTLKKQYDKIQRIKPGMFAVQFLFK